MEIVMPAPKGNEFWKARTSTGRKPKFESPDQLWELCCAYFEWVEANPLKEEKIFTYQGKIIRGTLNKMRPMTFFGLCLFLKIRFVTWKNYKKREDFLHITTRVERIIWDQKFVGAAANLLNPNIIARELGLRSRLGHGEPGSQPATSGVLVVHKATSPGV